MSCYQCHEIYPHEPEWAVPTKHGNFVSSSGRAACTTSCHGSDLKGGGSKVSCDQCHQLYPHPDEWEQKHRQVARDVGLASCARCHGADFKKEIGGKNCYSCHADYPHPARELWVPFQGGHGEKIKTEYLGKFDSCQKCHGEDLSRRINDENCSSCHPAYPVAHRQENWKRYEGHGAATPSTYPYGDCQLCHGAEYQGLRGNRSCYDCHNRFPHRSGWRRERGEPQDHGEFVRNNSSVGCATSHCHGENLIPTEVTRGASCRRCHEGYPHSNLDEWRRPAGHGADVLASGLVDSEGNPRCLQCHDRERGGPYGARSCQNAGCHSVYPHERMEDWQENHGREAVGRDVRDRRCAGCHGSDFRRVLGGGNCYSCHINFPHFQDLAGGGCPLDSEGNPQCWTRTWLTEREACETCTEEWCEGEVSCRIVSEEHLSPHAEQFLDQQASDFASPDPAHPEQFNQCRRCHGAGYQGGVSEVACSSCHPGYPHRVNNNWQTAEGGDHTASYLGGTRGTGSPCALCHRNLAGGLEGRATSCASATCHADYPHTVSGWTAPGRASEHASRIISARNASSCRACHGDDFSRVVGESEGHEGTSCRECHPQGPATHERIGGAPWYQPSGHGTFFSARYNSVSLESNCGNCHGRPVSFSESDTVATLRNRSLLNCDNCRTSCYQCHRAYPHTSMTNGGTEYPWEPVINTNTCGTSRNMQNTIGHILFLLDSPLLTNTSGQRPVLGTTLASSPLWRQAIQNTCGGGSAGSCHFKGNRSYRTGHTEPLCGQYCHGPDRPLPPSLPACPPPPPSPIPICEGGTCCYGEGCLEHCTADSCWEQ